MHFCGNPLEAAKLASKYIKDYGFSKVIESKYYSYYNISKSGQTK